ncbi:MAG: family 16 glycosylhydrolase [Ignavibacteria bacterium]|jgi:beta-glucanase (GH16 family)
MYIQSIKGNILVNKKLIALLFLLLLMGLPFKFFIAQDYQLVWSDEFDGDALDETKWEYQTGNGPPSGWGNNEWEYYRAENAVVEDGYLTIIAKEESYSGFNYTSARIRTINKGDWKYGKIEVRAKMPEGQGIWPAIWMLPTDNVYGGWAASGEIDIMEYLGHQTGTIYGTLHYGGAWPNNTSSGTSYTLPSGGFNEDFHVFTLTWEEGKFQWLVDGELYQTQTSWHTSGYSFPAPFDQRFHLLLNMAVGGNWPGYPDTTTQFPQEFVIDYVRVYQDETATGIEEYESELPEGFLLEQNYPNPFNSQTIIRYELSKPGHVELQLVDMLGRTAATLVNKIQGPGVYSVTVDASDLSSGAYTYCLKVGNKYSRRKLILIK